MPVGIQRLNARKSQPNPHIVFIKPLKGPDEDVARQFLERIAAQCVPIMRDNHLSVVTLEEYEPNREFVGRNFNAGEVIQLVLKARGSRGGPTRWLPVPYVQMVMMHELAHCRQMNHSRAFWAVRDTYAAHMRRLWTAKYTGEGMWGRGARLGSDAAPPLYEVNMALPDENDDALLLEHLCGGTYQSRSRRRKRRNPDSKPVLTYREREDRRIRRKFGVNGVALGDDLAERAKLAVPAAEKKKKQLATKPRVAVSKRGRELRAAAALARFSQDQAEKKEEEKKEVASVKDEGDEDVIVAIKREEDDYESETDSGAEDEDAGADATAAIDIDGTQMRDGHGRSMVRVCEAESTEDDADAKRELRELLQTANWGSSSQAVGREKPAKKAPAQQNKERHPPQKERPPASTIKASARPAQTTQKTAPVQASASVKGEAVKGEQADVVSLLDVPQFDSRAAVVSAEEASGSPADHCPICSFANGELAITCAVCGHVLHADAVPGVWHCQSTACRTAEGTRFLNAGDCGVCGVCGAKREKR